MSFDFTVCSKAMLDGEHSLPRRHTAGTRMASEHDV